MGIYSGVLVAENTSVKLCDIQKPRGFDSWFANVAINGSAFGGGTVSLHISFDGGTTKYPINQDGTASAASVTAAGAVNIRCGWTGVNQTTASLYASIGAATTPSLTIYVLDNR